MSCDVKKQNQIWRFEIDRPNTGEMTIIDPLLDGEARAKQRAESEFLKNAYISKVIQFRTYRTDLELNQIVNIAGVPFLIKNLSFVEETDKIVATVTAKRYE